MPIWDLQQTQWDWYVCLPVQGGGIGHFDAKKKRHVLVASRPVFKKSTVRQLQRGITMNLWLVPKAGVCKMDTKMNLNLPMKTFEEKHNFNTLFTGFIWNHQQAGYWVATHKQGGIRQINWTTTKFYFNSKRSSTIVNGLWTILLSDIHYTTYFFRREPKAFEHLNIQ